MCTNTVVDPGRMIDIETDDPPPPAAGIVQGHQLHAFDLPDDRLEPGLREFQDSYLR
jgi:hypothetical protein